MTALLADSASQWPLAPLGGLFVLAMGVFVILGVVVGRLRMTLIWLGFVAGLAAIAYGVTKLGLHPPPPTQVQVLSLIAAVGLEFAGFVFLMRPQHRRGERAVVAGTLMIVGTHFIVMWPAFGPLIAAMGAACCINAALAWRTRYGLRGAWFTDGALKAGFGALMALPALLPI